MRDVRPARRVPDEASLDATRSLELAIARILQWGIGVSVVLLLVGAVLMLADGISPLDPSFPPFDPREIAAGMLALEPTAFIWLGLAITIATPAARVAASLVGFLREGDRRMAGVAVGILVVIALSVVVAGAAAA